MEQILAVDKADECRRTCGRLGHIIDFQAAAFVCRRLDTQRRVGEHFIKLACGNAHRVLRIDKANQLKQAVEPLTGFGGNEDNRRITHKGKIIHQLFALFVHRVPVFFDRVPFIHRNNARFAELVRNTGNFGVLFGKAFGRVNHNYTDVGAFHRHAGAQDRIFFNLVFDFVFAAKPCGVDKYKIAEFVFDNRVRRVARGARDIGDDCAFLAGNGVNKRRLADIRFADNRHADSVAFVLAIGFVGQIRQNSVEQIAGAVAVNGGNGNRVAEP